MDREDISYELIATTQDTGDPVMRAELGESVMEVIMDTGDKCLNVWRVESEQDGHMSMMLDDMVEDVGYDWVQFIAPLDDEDKKEGNEFAEELVGETLYDLGEDNLEDVLEDFERVTEVHQGKKVPMLVGFWET